MKDTEHTLMEGLTRENQTETTRRVLQEKLGQKLRS